MPGNIRVAVLEAVDLPATVTAGKSVAVKVAVGKREFQTILANAQDGRTQPWNSEFFFPVLNLRDNLLLAILDSKGEVVAKAELETPGIVQKGSQDAFVTLKAGGRIHVKVSFVLSEEERKKIEAMRAASFKKRKGFSNQAKSRQAPTSTVKITEITPESDDASSLKKSPKHRSLPKEEMSTQPGVQQFDEACTTVHQASEKEERPSGQSVNAGNSDAASEYKQDGLSSGETADIVKKKYIRHNSSFSWFSGKLLEDKTRCKSQSAADGSQWLETLKLRSKEDKARAAKADEWIRNMDAGKAGRESLKQEGLKLKKQLDEEKKKLKHFEQKRSSEARHEVKKSVKQRLEDWKLKELGPWRKSTSKVRHASPPGDVETQKSRWLFKNPKTDKTEERSSDACLTAEEDLMAAADRMWASTVNDPNDQKRRSFAGSDRASGGLKGAVKQVLNGAAVMAGAFGFWPKKASKKERSADEGDVYPAQRLDKF